MLLGLITFRCSALWRAGLAQVAFPLLQESSHCCADWDMPAFGAAASLAEQLELDDDLASLDIASANKITEPLSMMKMSKPEIADNLQQKCSFEALPVTPLVNPKKNDNCVHVIDCLRDFEGDIDKQQVIGLMLANSIGDLPEPICPRKLLACLFFFLFTCWLSLAVPKGAWQNRCTRGQGKKRMGLQC